MTAAEARMHKDPAYWRILNATSTTTSASINREQHAAEIWHVVQRARKHTRVRRAA